MDEEENDAETQTTITQGPSGHSQILHVRQDSATELDQLFKAVMNPNFKSKSLPMKLRKLPKSFFQQPDRPRHPAMHAHSRSMGGLVSTSVNHSRSSSTDSSTSHASGLNLSSNNIHQQASSHGNSNVGQRAGNYAHGPAQHHGFNAQSHLGLPIAHSRSKSSPASLQIMNANMMKVSQQNNSGIIEIPPDMPLPQGWEVAKTNDGQMYFMNHPNRTTTWIDPRITILKERQQQEHANQSNLQTTTNHQAPTGLHVNNVQQNDLLPSGWEQATTEQGEIYFINHESRTTSWLDPRQQAGMGMAGGNQAQMNAQMQQQMHKINQLDLSTPAFPQQRNVSESHMIKRLAKEKEMLIMRQRELLKQQVTTTGMDPFLGGSSSSYHEREPSRDSGVSGMGSNFNLPRASDDYLGSVEEMETDGGNHNQQVLNQQQSCMATVRQAQQQHVQHAQHSNSQQRHFPDFLDTLPASSVDFNGDVGNQPSNSLDGEDLVPSIGETLSPDFMNDVESMLNPAVKSENMDSMTWL